MLVGGPSTTSVTLQHSMPITAHLQVSSIFYWTPGDGVTRPSTIQVLAFGVFVRLGSAKCALAALVWGPEKTAV